MFPGAGAQVYRNEAGEPTGWDYPQYDEGPDPDDLDDDGEPDLIDCEDCDAEFDDVDDYENHRSEEHGT